MYIRKEKKDILPNIDIYKECLLVRLKQMKNVNKKFEVNDKPIWETKI